MSGRWNTNVDGVALDGYDPVAYHAMHDAVRGMADLAVEHDGVRFLFASDEHRDAFRQEPERYAPAFGGWCAFAVAAKKEMVKADPRTFKPGRGWTLDELAGSAGMSRSHLAARFRETVGTTPIRYLNSWRMARAKDLLRATEQTIAQVAEHTGYQSEFAFAKAFKRYFGVTPGAARRGEEVA